MTGLRDDTPAPRATSRRADGQVAVAAWSPRCIGCRRWCAAALSRRRSLAPASAYPAPTVTLEGHGYGHGHGMGQWGALGYAADRDRLPADPRPLLRGDRRWPASSAAQEATQVRVALTENDGNTVIVTSGSAFTVPGCRLDVGGPGGADEPGRRRRLERLGGPGVRRPVAGHAGGPGVSDPTANPDANPGLGDPTTATQALQLCQGGGQPDRAGVDRGHSTTPTARPGPSTSSRSSSTSPGSSQRVPGRMGHARAAPARRASRGDSRSSRPRPWRPART